jgi:TrmH family RNA methyltransferase
MFDHFDQRLCVVLVRTQGPINLGLVARACANTGITDLRLVAPQCPVDCSDARKFANHAKEQLLAAPVYERLDQAVADCGLVIGTTARDRDNERGTPLPLNAAAALMAERPAERYALVFGNEADGLSTNELQGCQAFLHLATPGPYPSYNLSHAVAIVAYHLTATTEPVGIADNPAAERVHVDRLGRYWLGTLERFRYFRRTRRESWEPHFADLLNRLRLGRRDIDILFGMLAQFNYFAFGDKGEEMAHSGRQPISSDEQGLRHRPQPSAKEENGGNQADGDQRM